MNGGRMSGNTLNEYGGLWPRCGLTQGDSEIDRWLIIDVGLSKYELVNGDKLNGELVVVAVVPRDSPPPIDCSIIVVAVADDVIAVDDVAVVVIATTAANERCCARYVLMRLDRFSWDLSFVEPNFVWAKEAAVKFGVELDFWMKQPSELTWTICGCCPTLTDDGVCQPNVLEYGIAADDDIFSDTDIMESCSEIGGGNSKPGG